MKTVRSKSGKLVRLIGAQLGLTAFTAKKATAFNPDFSDVVRGIFVELTPYKDTYYLRNFYGLFFIRRHFVSLDYSKRIANLSCPVGTRQFTGGLVSIAEAATRSVIEPQLLADVAKDSARQSLISKLWATYSDHNFAVESSFNLACLLHLSGAHDESLHLFSKCALAVKQMSALDFLRPSDLDLFAQIEKTVDVSAQQPHDLRDFLLANFKANARDLGFVCTETAPP